MFLLPRTLLAAALFINIANGDGDDGQCTHGRIFLSDSANSDVHVMNLDTMQFIDEAKFTVPGGGVGQILSTTDTPDHVGIVTAVYRGTEENKYLDGTVNFYTTGLEFEFHTDHYHAIEGNPTYLTAASFECARPIHIVAHDEKIAIFCDGFFSEDVTEQVNTTVWLVDESMITSSNPIILTETLQGSHHGVAVPIDDGHLLISRATQARVNGTTGVSSLPDGFTVQDYDGNLVHDLNQDGNRDRSCPGYHGSAAIDNTFTLACDATHGGIVVVDYDNEAYTSYAIDYPAALEGVRTGSFAENPHTDMVVGNLASPDQNFLLAFNPKADEQLDMFDTKHLLEVPIRPCSFKFEKGTADHLLVWMPDGMLNVYEVAPAWKLVDSIEVVPGMTQCSAAFLVTGYGHAVVVEGQNLHSVELVRLNNQDDSDPLQVETSTLDFIPMSALIAGVYIQDEACQIEAEIPFNICFPGESIVSVKVGENVEQRPMNALALGDLVEVAKNKFEAIYSFGHYDGTIDHEYLYVRTDNDQELKISPDHMIFSKNTFVAARDLVVGDSLTTGETTTAIKSIHKINGNGAYAPFTPSGTIIVDGILVSSFAAVTKSSFNVLGADISMHTIGHAFEFPHRLMCHYTTTFCPSEQYTAEGISTPWVSGGLGFAQWMMGQKNDIVRNVMLFFVFAGLTIFAIMEFILENLLSVTAASILLAVIAASGFTIKVAKN